MATATIGIRERMAAASRRIARVKLLDRGATGVITLGGVFIILNVLFIFVFIFAEAFPLFRPAGGQRLSTLRLTAAPTVPAGGVGAPAGPATLPLAFGVDEHQMYLYTVSSDPKLVFYRLPGGGLQQELPIPSLAGATLTAAARSLLGNQLAVGTSDGRLGLLRVRFRPVFQEQTLRDLDLGLADAGVVELDAKRRPIRELSLQEADGETLVVAVVGDEELAVAHLTPGEDSNPPTASLETLRTHAGDAITHVCAGRSNTVVAGTRNGKLYHWEVGSGDATRLTDLVEVGPAPLSALAWSLGGSTVIVGDTEGRVSAWFRARPSAEAGLTLVKAHEFESQGSAIRSIGPSTRERSFVTGAADGSLVLRHLTSERTLLRFPATGNAAASALLTPRADGILAWRADGTLDRYSVRDPHPEFSWRAMFGRVWYEGYPGPSYVWQSTGATDDFEPKLSLVPLVFGTIKATFYALVFAVPLAVMAALYTSQFMHPRVKARVKPTVEIMAALPSVVIGFIAGLWLAARVEAALVPVLLMTAFLPLFGTAGVLVWGRLPRGLRRRLRPGTEILVILPLLLLGGWAALWAGPWVEGTFFAGDARHWLSETLGLRLRPAQQHRGRHRHGFRGDPDHLHDLRGRLLERAPAPDRRLARPGREPLADGDPGRAAHGEPRDLLGRDGGLRPRGGRDHDRADGDREHASHRLVALQRDENALRQHRGRGARGPSWSDPLPGALPLGLRALRDDLLREHRGGAGPAAAAREVPGHLMGSRGEALVWFTGSALGICLLMVVGLLVVILANGLGAFWPERLEQLTLRDGTLVAGELVQRQAIPDPDHAGRAKRYRLRFKVGNRDLYGFDFRWVDESEIAKRETPGDLCFVERSEYGPLIGVPVRLLEAGKETASGPAAVEARLPQLLAKAARDRARLERLEKGEIGAVNYGIERIRLENRKLDYREKRDPSRVLTAERTRLRQREAALQERYAGLEQRLAEATAAAADALVTFRTVDGQEKELRALDLYRVYPANRLSALGRARVYAGRLLGFLTGDPREANTEGGVFPAIFGTVMMVFLMSLAVVPLGVLAALYLREYARQGALVRTVRIAVNNLAGVPSIVFGVFGLGFFVYFVGGNIDRLFFPETLPTPTYGTGGILWASLTLALLTVPVVIVAAEEALASVPRSVREASLAMGATKLQTILRVVLPAAAPGILTGLILAMARAAGEVAPLMLTGVVKLAPELPLDGFFPFFHLDRKFMHLGFHIYDVGFQSPNVEAAKPMVYMTTLLLLAIVVVMNLAAIVVRNRLRERYRTSTF